MRQLQGVTCELTKGETNTYYVISFFLFLIVDFMLQRTGSTHISLLLLFYYLFDSIFLFFVARVCVDALVPFYVAISFAPNKYNNIWIISLFWLLLLKSRRHLRWFGCSMETFIGRASFQILCIVCCPCNSKTVRWPLY